ncbi:MAG: DUF3343 domain-containing protein [Clostridia bacterium]|nr:DUF3343 domain-containing protein [Clostridia bacterium]
MNCLIIFRSVTHAQTIISYLSKNSVMADLVRPPLILGTGSCSYGVRLRCDKLHAAISLINKTRIRPVKAYKLLPNEGYREVSI